MFACLYAPPSEQAHPERLAAIAGQFSPRYEQHRDDLMSIDLSGLARLFGDAETIGEELRRTARTHQVQAHVAIAGTRAAAMLLAHARPGLTVVAGGGESAALAPLPIGVLARVSAQRSQRTQSPDVRETGQQDSVDSVITVLKTWGVRTLGEFAALPSADLSARLGQDALAWQALARGEDARPLVPTAADERFESTLELEWPIDGLEPLSFVLTRLLEPLVIRLERRDRGAAAIVTMLRLASREACERRIELPTPLRDVRALRTLVLLDLESNPAGGAVDVVTVRIEPTPGRILQHTLFARPTPTPEQLSTLVARLHAVMGQERVGAPALVDTYRPGAFAMKPFATDHEKTPGPESNRGDCGDTLVTSARSADSAVALNQAVRRCRQPVVARVAVEGGRPVRVTTDRRGYAGGHVVRAWGPWRTTGDWWSGDRFARDEWEVAIADGTVYRVFRDELSERWFVDAVFD